MSELRIGKGDITNLGGKVAIVNAADSNLSGGGGVDKDIQNAAGSEFKHDCEEFRKRHQNLPTGCANIMPGGHLSQFVINTVGPKIYKYPSKYNRNYSKTKGC